jgi:hypothetical protein
VERLDEIPGIGPVAAAVIAEIGLDMTRFPTAGHLCSWAKFSPGINSSAAKNMGNGSTGHGDRYLARVLGQAASIAGRTDTFLGERYRRIARPRGRRRRSSRSGARCSCPLTCIFGLDTLLQDRRLARLGPGVRRFTSARLGRHRVRRRSCTGLLKTDTSNRQWAMVASTSLDPCRSPTMDAVAGRCPRARGSTRRRSISAQLLGRAKQLQ